ncbi:MAG: FGGY family carbohydrate kinase [Ruthenibacterium lactatiformans]
MRRLYEEVHRFENCPREKDGRLRWDFSALMDEVRTGLGKAAAVDSIGFDTLGCGFWSAGQKRNIAGRPGCTTATAALPEWWSRRCSTAMDARTLYGATGNQIMAINTPFQACMAVKEQAPEVWRRAKRLLFMPDLFIHALCGAQVCERTIASTSQMQDARTGAWDRDVLAAYRIPERMFALSAPSGTVVSF